MNKASSWCGILHHELAYFVDIHIFACHAFSGRRACRRDIGSASLHVEEEVHDVAVLDDIFLAFGGELSGGSDGTFVAECDEIIVLDDFCPDESLLEVRVDDSGGFRCLVTLVDCPCAALV